ncbi:MAG TPA: isoleucine--tRNA ligase [Tepidisphaeraceae bacterium]|jgi:isoleucyl-tRNA synthetase|nr:isoleucine--tRNA ligase [Tepidisphaeraceae bacterium]
MEEKKNYKTTLNLPQTAFAMEAKLTANEPTRLKKWNELRLYEKLMERHANDPKWILHDGPPFANGDIHIGHLINKTLKDVILRFRSMQGYQTPYVPGWDCHGLPIEHKIQQDLGPKLRQMNVTEVRRLCREYAEKYVKVQGEQFQRLGILGEWANPYVTMSRDYEAQTLEVFAKFVEADLVYKKLKPVPWSIENQTALADAELEYKDVEDTSVYVEFPLDHPAEKNSFLIIWTTTPWTLPANLAVAVNPDVNYAKVKYRRDGQDRIGIVATDLAERVFKDRSGIESFEVVGSDLGNKFVGNTYRHPFIDNLLGRVVVADYVTTTDGTGLVHSAPGHGEDDYNTGIREGLEVYSPVLASGRFDESVPQFIRGKTVWESNPLIIAELKKRGLLFAEEKIVHSYPHDWRSKKPIIFRATEQWFVSVDKPLAIGDGKPRSLRQRALEVVNGQVDFVPRWGQARLAGMLESRPDWCVSRQRAWGLPIPVFYNEKGEALLTSQSVRAVAKRFAEKGSGEWFTESPKELLGADFKYPTGFSAETLRKEKDIFDVWFESGSSWHAVLQQRKDLSFPADLYLEGSDQHRGWFQLSLLLSLGTTGKPPFKQVVTHGFVVKPDGTKVSKSDKEYVTATQEINKHGADLLRLWCSSVDYQNDIPASPSAIQEFGDKYRKIRNTLRFLLSNLYDFDPKTDSTPIDTRGLDGWVLFELDQLIREVKREYESYQLHRVFRRLHDFCAVQVSTIYSTAMKDRLYCELPNSPLRRRCQRVMYQMADAIIRLLAPILVFTADEAWEHLPHKSDQDANAESVHLLSLPKFEFEPSAKDQTRWALLRDARDQATAQLDVLKKSVGLNKALDAEIVYHLSDEARKDLEGCGPDLEDVVGAGFHSFASGEWRVEVVDRREKYKACDRSWKRRPDVGEDAEYPDLSRRDAAAVRAVQAK